MNLIMLYMSGSQVQIFSMGVIVMLLWNPFVNFFKVNSSTCPFICLLVASLKLLLILSICSICTCGKGFQSIHHAVPPKSRVPPLPSCWFGYRSVEVSANGFVAHRNGWLACFRDKRVGELSMLSSSSSSLLIISSWLASRNLVILVVSDYSNNLLFLCKHLK